jgi:hypothetical protein
VLLAAAVRAVSAMGLGVIPRDGCVYVETARAVAGGNLLAALDGAQHPLFPLLAGALGGSESAAVVLAVVAGSLGVVPVLRIGTRLHSRALGLLAALLYAVAPVLVRYQAAPLAEGLFLLLALWSIERSLAAADRPSAGFVAGLVGGAAYLARPEGLLLLAALPVSLAARRRWAAGLLLVAGFVVAGGPYAAHLSAAAGGPTLSRKKPAARFVVAEEGFDRHMEEKSRRTGLPRPTAIRAGAETLRTYGEALSWALLPLAVAGGFLLLKRGEGRPVALLLLALLLLDLLLRFRLLHLHGYLGRRHLVLAAALTLPWAAGGLLVLGRRWSFVIAGVLAAALLFVAVRARDGEKRTLRQAGRWILTQAGPDERVATYLTPRVPYYAFGRDVKLQRLPGVREGTATPAEIRARLAERADWIALVPERMDESARRVLLPAVAGLAPRAFGEGEWRVLVFRTDSP